MISTDTNVLFPAVVRGHPQHGAARAFLDGLNEREDVLVSEFVLVELYLLLRDPAVVSEPLSSERAAATCAAFRTHPRWRLVGFSAHSRELHDALWRQAAAKTFPRRRIFDLRTALTLVEHGVREFATVNTRDFAAAGFERVFNPLA